MSLPIISIYDLFLIQPCKYCNFLSNDKKKVHVFQEKRSTVTTIPKSGMKKNAVWMKIGNLFNGMIVEYNVTHKI